MDLLSEVASFILGHVSEILSLASVIAACAAVYVALYVSYRAELPQVVLYLEHDEDLSCVYIVAANLGKGVAWDIQFPGFDFTIVQDDNRDYAARSFLAKGIPVLVPGAKRRTIVADSDMRGLADLSVRGTLRYRQRRMFGRGLSKPVDAPYVLDYYSFSGNLYTTSDMHTIAVSLKNLDKQLSAVRTRDSKSIATSLKTIADCLDSSNKVDSQSTRS